MRDDSTSRCYSKIQHTRDAAIKEATRLGYPIAPYKCPNGLDHWHVGNSRKNALLFYSKRTQWEGQSRNKDG